MNSASPARPRVNIVDLYPEVATLQDGALRDAIGAIWDALWSRSAWSDPSQVPTSAEIDHPNLPHTRSVLQIALSIADAFATHHGIQVNRDHLIASAVLQDASKVVEYEPDAQGRPVKSEIGRTFPHAFWCAHLGVLHGLPNDICDTILSHSPAAPRFPSSLEGKILYYADQVDLIGIHGDRWKKHLFISK